MYTRYVFVHYSSHMCDGAKVFESSRSRSNHHQHISIGPLRFSDTSPCIDSNCHYSIAISTRQSRSAVLLLLDCLMILNINVASWWKTNISEIWEVKAFVAEHDNELVRCSSFSFDSSNTKPFLIFKVAGNNPIRASYRIVKETLSLISLMSTQ